jgi:uncharacterized protein (TIGR02594 family)
MSEPIWIAEARRHIGQREIPGKAHNPWIVDLWRRIKRGGIKSEDVPWCAAFVGACLEACGIVSSRFEGATSYLQWGQRLVQPTVGCVAVFSRSGGGHVAFVVGVDAGGRLMCLGGNQGDAVTIAPLDRSRAVGFRWPPGEPLPALARLPLIASTSASSSNEA